MRLQYALPQLHSSGDVFSYFLVHTASCQPQRKVNKGVWQPEAMHSLAGFNGDSNALCSFVHLHRLPS